MGLLEYQECLALYWTKTGSVYGVRVNIKNQKLQVLNTAAFEIGDGSFSVAFSQAIEQLIQPTTHLIVAGGNLAGSVCFDITVPQMGLSDIKQAIQYELPRHMPCDPTEISFGYRIIKDPSRQEESSRMLIRVFAVLKKDWNELVTEFTSSEIRIDAFLSPQQVLEPLLADVDEFYIPDVDEEFSYIRNEDLHKRQMVEVEHSPDLKIIPDVSELQKKLNYDQVQGVKEEDLEHFITPMLLAAYGLSEDFREGKNHLIALPREMVPERFRRLRISFFLFLIISILMIFGLGGRYWWDSWSKLNSIKVEHEKIDSQISRLQETSSKLDEIEKLIVELEEAEVGNNRMAKSLHLLSRIIPKDMWLAHFSTRGRSMDISVKAPSGKQSKLVTLLNKTGVFKVVNSYTRRNSDGTENIYIHLEFVGARSKKGGK